MKKSLKITLIVLVSIVAVLLIILLLLSPIAKSYVNKHGEELLSRKVQLEGLRVNPLSGTVNVTGLVLYEEDAATPFVSIDTIDVQVRLLKLLRHEVDLRHATIANLDIQLLQDSNRFNFSSIIDHFQSQQDTTQPQDTTSSNWALGFYNITLRHWKVYYADRVRGSEWVLKDVNLHVPGVYLSGEHSTDAGLELALADGGTFTTKLNYNMQSNDFEIDVMIEQFGIANVRAYLTDAMKVGDLQGTLSGHVQASGNLSEATQSKLNGTLQLNNVDIRDHKKKEVLAFNSLAVGIREIDLGNMRFVIDSVVLDSPATRFDRYAATNNFSDFFATETAPANGTTTTDTATADDSPALSLLVHKVLLRNGSVLYNDFSMEDEVSLPVTAINLTAEEVTTQGATHARLTAALPHGGSVNVLWHGNMNDIKANSALNASVRGLQLQDISPYSVHYVAYPFTDGIFAFSSENVIKEGQIEGRNNLDISNPMIGDRRKDADSSMHLPLKAALYILKDKEGNVKLDVPVSGDLNNPKFSYWKALWKTFGNLLVKVASSPIHKIGDALGLHNGEMPFIPIDPMQSELSSDQLLKLNNLAKVVQADSSLILIMAQQIDADAEDAILQLGEQRNEQVRTYMRSLGVRDDQLMVLTQEGLSGVKQIGYKIDSELRDLSTEEEEQPNDSL